MCTDKKKKKEKFKGKAGRKQKETKKISYYQNMQKSIWNLKEDGLQAESSSGN